MRRTWAVAVLIAFSVGASGCVGPSKLRRGLDEYCNQMYVDNPLLAQCVSPLVVVGEAVASVADATFVNPVYWWKDAMEGEGTPYYYRNPTIPAPSDE